MISKSDHKNHEKFTTIGELIAANAERTPNAIALMAPDRPSLAWDELNFQVQNVVGMLNKMGYGSRDRIVIVLQNGPEMAAAFLAVSSAFICAPLNPNYRESEFDFYLSDLNAKAVIVHKDQTSSVRSVARKYGISIVEISYKLTDPAGKFILSTIATGNKTHHDSAKSEDTALILHTSGTTSRPKMVPLTHANLCASARNIHKTLNLTTTDRCLNIMPLFHIHGLIGVCLSSIAAGASLVCTSGYDSNQFFNWLCEFQPTWYSAVPTMHQSILANSSKQKKVISNHSLRFIRSSSSSLPPKIMKDLEDKFKVPMIEAYGMSEASHQMCSNPLPPLKRKAGSVGQPTGQRVEIMDESGNLLSRGSIGEIVIQGENVTKGYENNPEANQSAFTSGWFRTGDQGRIDDEGYVFITGRIKEIINRGGEKISPREIDEVFLENPAIAQAVAFGIPHKRLGEDLAVAVVLYAGASVTEQELRDFAFSHLADHKVPSRIVIVAEIPKGPTGKLQRIGLYQKLESILKSERIVPRNTVESTLADIWCDVLELEEIGIRDNFFFLGGDSLLATSVASRVRATFDVELPVLAIFREPTIENGAREIEQLIIKQVEDLTDDQAQEILDSGFDTSTYLGTWKK